MEKWQEEVVELLGTRFMEELEEMDTLWELQGTLPSSVKEEGLTEEQWREMVTAIVETLRRELGGVEATGVEPTESGEAPGRRSD